MDGYSKLWKASGQSAGYLYPNSNDAIIVFLQAWVGRRKVRHSNLAAVRTMIERSEFLFQNMKVAELLEAENAIETRNARYLLATLGYRGIDLGSRIDCLPSQRTDADVCSFLGTLKDGIDAKVGFELLHAGANGGRAAGAEGEALSEVNVGGARYWP